MPPVRFFANEDSNHEFTLIANRCTVQRKTREDKENKEEKKNTRKAQGIEQDKISAEAKLGE